MREEEEVDADDDGEGLETIVPCLTLEEISSSASSAGSKLAAKGGEVSARLRRDFASGMDSHDTEDTTNQDRDTACFAREQKSQQQPGRGRFSPAILALFGGSWLNGRVLTQVKRVQTNSPLPLEFPGSAGTDLICSARKVSSIRAERARNATHR